MGVTMGQQSMSNGTHHVQTMHVHTMYTQCTHHVQTMYTPCTHHVHTMYTQCTDHVVVAGPHPPFTDVACSFIAWFLGKVLTQTPSLTDRRTPFATSNSTTPRWPRRYSNCNKTTTIDFDTNSLICSEYLLTSQAL